VNHDQRGALIHLSLVAVRGAVDLIEDDLTEDASPRVMELTEKLARRRALAHEDPEMFGVVEDTEQALLMALETERLTRSHERAEAVWGMLRAAGRAAFEVALAAVIQRETS